MTSITLEPLLSKIALPVLFIHGDADNDVSHEQSWQAAKLIRTPCEVEIIKGGGHTLKKPEEQAKTIERTVQWFAAQLHDFVE